MDVDRIITKLYPTYQTTNGNIMSVPKHTDNYWKAKNRQWQYAMDHYDGTYAIRELYEGRISDYLVQKYQRENNKAFEERSDLSDPVLHFGTVVDSINGTLASKQDDTIRDFGALGDPNIKGTIAEQLWYNADGNGTNWNPLFKRVGIKLTVLNELWGYVQGVTETSDPCIKLIDPRYVVSRYPAKGNPESVIVAEKMDLRKSINDDAKQDELVYTHFTVDGWEQYHYDGDAKVVIDSGEYAYYATSRRDKRILPIFRVEIPMPRNVGYLLAMKENHIYNQKSVRDFAIRNMSYAVLKLGVEDQAEFDGMLDNMEKGANVIPQRPGMPEHRYLSADSSWLAQSQAILERDVEEFYINAFKKFGEAASQVTATAIKLESQSGIESFLNLLTESVDEFENQALWRLEQVYFPNESNLWGNAVVKRSSNFQIEEIPDASELANIAVNLERSKSASIERRVRLLNPTWGDEEVRAEIAKINAEYGASPNPPELIE
jgi:hypothetical protein